MPEETSSNQPSVDAVTATLAGVSKAISETANTAVQLTQQVDVEKLVNSSVELIAKTAESLSKIILSLGETVANVSADVATGSGKATESISKTVTALAETLNKSTAGLSETTAKLGKVSAKRQRLSPNRLATAVQQSKAHSVRKTLEHLPNQRMLFNKCNFKKH